MCTSQKAMRRQKTYFLWLWLLASPASCDDARVKSICNVAGAELIFSSSTCPSQGSISTTGWLDVESHNGWEKGDSCQDLRSAKFCSYTKPSFNDGFGVSVITTPKRFDEVATLLALTQIGTKRPWRNTGPSYQEEEIHGKGAGLVATRRIAAGELVLARTPAVLVDDEGFKNLGEGSLTQLLVQAIEGLPQQHQSEYLKLSTHDEVQGHDERTYQIFAKNNYRTKFANTTDFHATFIDGTFPYNFGWYQKCPLHCPELPSTKDRSLSIPTEP